MQNKINKKAAKFGGTSTADHAQSEKVGMIIKNDPSIKVVAFSAPGKRFSTDEKITDQLFEISTLSKQNLPWIQVWEKICVRYSEIINGLGLSEILKDLLSETKDSIYENDYEDFIVSRGEYIYSKVMVAYLNLIGVEAYFVDAKDCVVFNRTRLNYQKTLWTIKKKKKANGVMIIPGFYGADASGRIHIFSRGGSDLTGALAACGLRVSVYENWTDVEGVCTSDPKKVKGTRTINFISYKDAHILTSFGASVLHEETVPFLVKYGITLHIRNTNNPDGLGTKIMPKVLSKGNAIGIACQSEVTVFSVSKIIPRSSVGYGEKLFHIFALNNIPYIFELPGSDEFSLIIADSYLHGVPNASKMERNKKLNECLVDLKYEIEDQIDPDYIEILKDLSVITVVGSGPTTLSKVLNVLISNDIPCPIQHRGSSGQVIIAVSNDDAYRACQLVHDELFNNVQITTSSNNFEEDKCKHI